MNANAKYYLLSYLREARRYAIYADQHLAQTIPAKHKLARRMRTIKLALKDIIQQIEVMP